MKFASRRSSVRAVNGMVSTTQPLAAAAGLRMIMEGGNAVDAAVCAAAVLNVVEPHSTGVGGDLFALVWTAREKRVRALNASGRSPAGADADALRRMGLSAVPDDSAWAVTVPGAVSGWEALLNRYGRMPLADVLRPAVGYAEDGFPVSEIIADHWRAGAPRLAAGPAGGELLLNGAPPAAGEIMRIPTLANTLRSVAEGGADAFYNGAVAARIARFAQAMGGWLSESDFARHAPEWVEPASVSYRGVDCWQCPPPSQGVNALMALNICEGFDLAGMGFQSADALHHMIEAMRLAFADALEHVADPAAMRVLPEALLSKEYAAARRAAIAPNRAMATAASGSPPAHPNTGVRERGGRRRQRLLAHQQRVHAVRQRACGSGNGHRAAQSGRVVLAGAGACERAGAEQAAVPHAHARHDHAGRRAGDVLRRDGHDAAGAGASSGIGEHDRLRLGAAASAGRAEIQRPSQ